MTDELPHAMTDPAESGPGRMRPPDGLYAGVLYEEYRRWLGASQSRLQTAMKRTPRRVRYEMQNPAPSTESQIDGIAAHVATLQPTLFDTFYPQRPTEHPNSNAYKAAAARLVGANPFAILLPDRRREQALRIADAVHRHPEASRLLGGNAEHSASWRDPETGVACKARLDDWVPGVTLIDLKTTADASPEEFARALWDYGYHIQAALSLRASRALALDCPHFTIIAAEKDEPYDLACYRVHEGSIDVGEEWLDRVLPLWAQWETSGVWPSYRGLDDLSLPAFAFARHREWLERFG